MFMNDPYKYHKINVDYKEYIIQKEHIKKMRKNKLEISHIRTRIKSGWSLDDAVEAPLKMSFIEFQEHLFIKNEEEKAKQRAIEIKKKYEKPKPWLEKYPQVTEFGKYAQKLFKECCGSW